MSPRGKKHWRCPTAFFKALLLSYLQRQGFQTEFRPKQIHVVQNLCCFLPVFNQTGTELQERSQKNSAGLLHPCISLARDLSSRRNDLILSLPALTLTQQETRPFHRSRHNESIPTRGPNDDEPLTEDRSLLCHIWACFTADAFLHQST